MTSQDRLARWKQMQIDPNYSASWGCLHVFVEPKKVDDQTSLNELRREVSRIYEVNGSPPFDWSAFLDKGLLADRESVFPAGGLNLSLQLSRSLGDDDVFVFGQSEPGWYAIMSKNYEWTLPGANPLALALSFKYSVLVTTSIENEYSEVSLYEGGRLKNRFLQGMDSSNLELGLSGEPFDWSWFDGKGSVLSSPELEAEIRTTDLGQFLELAGPDARGLRQAFLDAPLEDYEPQSFLVFRARPPQHTK